jgi:hypothetical protein
VGGEVGVWSFEDVKLRCRQARKVVYIMFICIIYPMMRSRLPTWMIHDLDSVSAVPESLAVVTESQGQVRIKTKYPIF